jgi:hypothetical protein
MKFIKVAFLIVIVYIINLLSAEVNVTPITHFAQAQHYGNKAISISDSIIVCRSVTGIDIFRILPDNDIFLESHLDILSPLTMRVKNNYVYLSSIISIEENEIMRFSQIDITNISQPEIIRQIDYNYPERSVFIEIFNSNQLFMYEHITEEISIIHIYELPQMELISSIELNVRHLLALNDTTAHYYDGWGEEPTQNLQLFDVSNPSQIELIQEINVAQYHSMGGRPKEFIFYNDTMLAAAGNTCITFWDISNFTNWEYISQFIYEDGSNETMDSPTCITENKLVINDNKGLALYDIEDLDNIELLNFIEGEISNLPTMANTTYFKMRDNFIYVTGLKDGVHRYEISDNSIQYLGTNLEMPSFLYIIVNGYTIIAHSLDYGIYFFDLSDPENPIIIPDYLNYENSIATFYENNNLAVSYVEDGSCYFDLYDISDPYDVHLISQYPLELYEFVISANEDWSEIFIQSFDYNNPYFRKALINQSGNLENFYTYDLPSLNFKMKDDYGYYLTSNREMFHLDVLNGLNSDYPELINSIEIGNYTPGYMSFVINNSLLQFSSFIDETTFFYDTINPSEPQFLTRLSQNTLSAGLAYHNHYFSANFNTSFIYDLNNSSSVVYPIDQVTSHTNIYAIKEMVINNEEYLIVDNQGSLEIWALNITQSVEDELLKPQVTLSNYPNPFNPTTTISFSVTQNSDFVNLDIYNIKGQKVKQLVSDSANQLSAGQHSVIWDGTDFNNKPVSSGIYMYQLKVDGKAIASKKCLLLK